MRLMVKFVNAENKLMTDSRFSNVGWVPVSVLTKWKDVASWAEAKISRDFCVDKITLNGSTVFPTPSPACSSLPATAGGSDLRVFLLPVIAVVDEIPVTTMVSPTRTRESRVKQRCGEGVSGPVK